MLSKSDISLITSLGIKKFRDKHGLFVAEGEKLVQELRHTLCVQKIYTTLPLDADNTEQISEVEMKKISFLKHPSPMLGVFHIPQHTAAHTNCNNTLCVVLDGIQDPGNLGTIIRLCDWFGIEQLICSPETADCYNPKVVQASMGALARVQVLYTALVPYLETARQKTIPIYGTFLEGSNIYEEKLSPSGLIVMGNEGQGISDEVASYISQKLHIPCFARQPASESLNVAIATAVVCSEFRRR